MSVQFQTQHRISCHCVGKCKFSSSNHVDATKWSYYSNSQLSRLQQNLLDNRQMPQIFNFILESIVMYNAMARSCKISLKTKKWYFGQNPIRGGVNRFQSVHPLLTTKRDDMNPLSGGDRRSCYDGIGRWSFLPRQFKCQIVNRNNWDKTKNVRPIL